MNWIGCRGARRGQAEGEGEGEGEGKGEGKSRGCPAPRGTRPRPRPPWPNQGICKFATLKTYRTTQFNTVLYSLYAD